MLQLEQHDGSDWRVIARYDNNARAGRDYQTYRIIWPGKPCRVVQTESRLIAALYDPRRNYFYQSERISP